MRDVTPGFDLSVYRLGENLPELTITTFNKSVTDESCHLDLPIFSSSCTYVHLNPSKLTQFRSEVN